MKETNHHCQVIIICNSDDGDDDDVDGDDGDEGDDDVDEDDDTCQLSCWSCHPGGLGRLEASWLHLARSDLTRFVELTRFHFHAFTFTFSLSHFHTSPCKIRPHAVGFIFN